MQVQPASISQVVEHQGRFVEIGSDVGSVVADLKRIDPSLGVRLNIDCPEPFWAVYCQPDERSTYLVLTAQAYQNHSGTWEGLDQRVVRRVERIGSSDYDYVKELVKGNEAADRAKARKRDEVFGEAAQEGWKILREQIGRNCSHMAVSREVA